MHLRLLMRFFCTFLLILSCIAISCSSGGKSFITFAVGEKLIIPVVSGEGITGTLIDLDDDGHIDGIDLDGDFATCELMLVGENDPIYSFDTDGDGEADLYLEISDPDSGQVIMNTALGMTGTPIAVVLNGNGSAIGLDNSGDGIADLCIVSVTLAGDVVAPVVESVSPAEDTTDVALNNVITALFNECMDSSTITEATFTLAHEAEAISGVVSYEDDFNTAVFSPLETMKPDSVYTVTLTTGIEDNSGNALSESKNWSFTTGAVEDNTAPTPGNSGIVAVSDTAVTTLTLDWTLATDAMSWQEDLMYKVIVSTSDNISTVLDAETDGDGRTVLQDWTADINTFDVTNLSESTTYYFTVLVRDVALNKAAYVVIDDTTGAAPDTTASVPGNSGTLVTSNVTESAVTLNWTAATDNVTVQANLEYLAYYSTSNNITNVADCEANGTAVGSYTANIVTKSVTGLTASTTYYFNVIVKDEAGNKAVYDSFPQATSAPPDITPPTPGNSGTSTATGVTATTMTLNWTAATDNVTVQANLEYLAYYSTSNNITSVADCESNGTAVGAYDANITTKGVTGLSSYTTYYFNLIVRDQAGNKAAYSTLTQATTDGTAPTPGNSGTITSASVTGTTLTLNWTAATDNASAQANLEYLAYYSTNNNISSVADCESNGIAIGAYSANTATKSVTGLTSSTTYYFNVVVRDETGNQSVYITLSQDTADVTAPDGYAVSIDQGTINSSNQTAFSFTFSDAEVGATYNYSVDDTNGGTTAITGSGTISTATDQITGINVSGLDDDTLTLTVYLTDASSNQGNNVTDTVGKDSTAPTGYSVSIDQAAIDSSNQTALSFTVVGAEVGATCNYSVDDTNGGTAAVTGSEVISSATDTISGIDVSGLDDDTLSLTVHLTDTNSNQGGNVVDTVGKDTSVPTTITTSGYGGGMDGILTLDGTENEKARWTATINGNDFKLYWSTRNQWEYWDMTAWPDPLDYDLYNASDTDVPPKGTVWTVNLGGPDPTFQLLY